MIYPILAALLEGIVLFLYLYSWLIVINGVFTIFARPKDKPREWKKTLKKITDPVNNIFRKVLRGMGGAKMPIDLSPMLSLIFIWAISRLLSQLARHLIR